MPERTYIMYSESADLARMVYADIELANDPDRAGDLYFPTAASSLFFDVIDDEGKKQAACITVQWVNSWIGFEYLLSDNSVRITIEEAGEENGFNAWVHTAEYFDLDLGQTWVPDPTISVSVYWLILERARQIREGKTHLGAEEGVDRWPSPRDTTGLPPRPPRI